MHAGRVAGDEKQLLRWSTRLTLYPPPLRIMSHPSLPPSPLPPLPCQIKSVITILGTFSAIAFTITRFVQIGSGHG